MKVVVNDANILIDLVKLDLLNSFFGLKLAFYTTSLVLDELHSEQARELNTFIEQGILVVEDLDGDEMMEIFILQSEKRQLSIQDCSAIVCAQKVDGDLITSDKNLRNFAKAKNIAVRGHLWCLDEMVKQETLSGSAAISKLEELQSFVNPRLNLPENACHEKIKEWTE